MLFSFHKPFLDGSMVNEFIYSLSNDFFRCFHGKRRWFLAPNVISIHFYDVITILWKWKNIFCFIVFCFTCVDAGPSFNNLSKFAIVETLVLKFSSYIMMHSLETISILVMKCFLFWVIKWLKLKRKILILFIRYYLHSLNLVFSPSIVWRHCNWWIIKKKLISFREPS